MWQSWDDDKNGKENVTDGKNYGEFDSGHVDSGFLSGANLVSTEDIDDERTAFDAADSRAPPAPEPCSVAPEPMRADSGVDLGLSEDLSQLTLKPVTLNPLSGVKVQSEPTVELTPVTTQFSSNQQQRIEHIQQTQANVNIQHNQQIQQQRHHDWTIYYMQDDDGDT